MAYECVGRNLPRIDGVDKVTGHALYGADIHLPGRLEAKVLRSIYPHAKILRIDASKAKALPGVKAVITPDDIQPIRIARFFPDRTIIAWEKVRYHGEPVAAVAAVDAETAEEALSLIQVEYEELPAVFDPFEAMQEGAPLVHEDIANYKMGPIPINRSGNILNQSRLQRGDVEDGFHKSALVYEESYRTQVVHHGFIQPHEATASVDSRGKLTIWSSNKAVFQLRGMVAEALQLPLSMIRVIGVTVGGDFGGKGAALIEPICCLLAIRSGSPVRLVLSREEEFTGTYTRHPASIQLKLGAAKDGTLLAFQSKLVFDSGAYSDSPGALGGNYSNLLGVYRFPNVDLSAYTVYTNNTPHGNVRAPGTPQLIFAIESHIDIMAAKLGIDPLEIRLRNGVVDGDPSPAGRATLHNVGLGQTLRQIEKHWDRGQTATANRGRGIACGIWHANMPAGGEGLASKACVKLNEDGTVVLLTGAAEVGGGQHSLLAQIVAEELGVPFENIVVVAADTDTTPQETGTGGSTVTRRVGITVKLAAQDAKEQILRLAAERLEANAEDLEIHGGQVHVKGTPAKSVSLATLANGAMFSPRGPILGTGLRQREEWVASLQEAKGIVDGPCYTTHFAEVEVDAETGQVRVLKYIAAHDVGFAISPVYVEGQIEGGVGFGLGFGLMEQIPSERGRNLVASLAEYKMPTATDMPGMDVSLLEVPTVFGPYGAKAIGEPPTTPVAAAIANAVYDAIGVRITELPITPEKIVAAMKRRSA